MIPSRSSGSLRLPLDRLVSVILLIVPLISYPQADSSFVVASIRPGVPAELVIANRSIITLRADVMGNEPTARVSSIMKRLERALTNVGQVTLTDSVLFGGHLILLDGEPLLYVSAMDVDPTLGEDLDGTTRAAMAKLRLAISEYREMRDSRSMVQNIGLVLFYTLLLAVAFLLLGRFRRWIRRRAEEFIEHGLDRSSMTGKTLSSSRTLLLIAQRMVMVLVGLLMLVFFYFWLTGVLDRIPLTRAWSEQMFHLVTSVLLWALEGILEALPGLAVVALIFILTKWTARLLRSFFTRIQTGEIEVAWLDAAIAAPTRRVAVLLLWVFALIIAYPYIPGSSSKAFQGVSVLAGVMLSLGSSGVVSQASSGLVVMFNRLVRVGECVAIGDLVTGVVKQIGYFNTILVTSYGEEVTVPNSTVLGSKVTNYSRAAKGVLWTTGVTIGYDSPWRQVHEMLLEAVRITPNIATDPAPTVAQHSLDDFYVDYRSTFVVQGPFRPTLTALHANIQDIFNANGVQIMSPHYERDPAKDKVVPPEMNNPGLRTE